MYPAEGRRPWRQPHRIHITSTLLDVDRRNHTTDLDIGQGQHAGRGENDHYQTETNGSNRAEKNLETKDFGFRKRPDARNIHARKAQRAMGGHGLATYRSRIEKNGQARVDGPVTKFYGGDRLEHVAVSDDLGRPISPASVCLASILFAGLSAHPGRDFRLKKWDGSTLG